MASERPALQTAFEIGVEEIKELKPGNALIIKYHGEVKEELCLEPKEKKSCSFERIYFSRGNDSDIYVERKNLGRQLAPAVLDSLEGDLEHSVFSFIPNTSETAFMGLTEAIHDHLNSQKVKSILNKETSLSPAEILKILSVKPRFEKLVVKDDKMRTFIANDKVRGKMISHVYDVTYGVVKPGKDTLIVLDDSVVRGATLKDSIIHILCTLHPKKIVILSSAPQIRYPDCYGIDMSQLDKFVAFQALVELLQDHNKEHLLEETLEKCLAQKHLPAEKMENHLIALYDSFTYEQVSKKIGQMLTPLEYNVEIEIIFQTLEGLHKACPNHTGDWYFSGNYPTPGGVKVVNTAFINYMQHNDVRAY